MRFDFKRAFNQDEIRGRTCQMIAYAIYRMDLFEHVDYVVIYLPNPVCVDLVTSALICGGIEFILKPGTPAQFYCVTNSGQLTVLDVRVRGMLRYCEAQSLRGRRQAIYIDHYFQDHNAIDEKFHEIWPQAECL